MTFIHEKIFDKIKVYFVQITIHYITVDCPVGTYSTSGNCNLCAKGTYQDEIGQITCKSCPTGITTKFLGSQDASSCTGRCFSAHLAPGV